MKEEKRKRDS